MKKSLSLTIGAISLFYTAASAFAGTAWFDNLSTIVVSSYPGLSSNGEIVTGATASKPKIWSWTNGWADPAYAISYGAYTMSGGYVSDGSTNNALVGTLSYIHGGPKDSRAVYWSSPTATPIVITDSLGNVLGTSSAAYSISSNGVYIAGSYINDPFLFKVDGGSTSHIVRLPIPSGSGDAIQSSNDAKTTIGSLTASGNYAVYWYSPTGFSMTASDYTMRYLSPTLASSTTATAANLNTEATSLSSDGAVIVGYATISGYDKPFKWTKLASDASIYTPTQLSLSAGAVEGQAFDVNSNGTVIVGAVGGGSVYEGVRWESGTIKTISQWLADSGVTVNLGSATVLAATHVSDDGSVVSGVLTGNQFFIARGLGSPSNSGLITLDDLSQSLTNNSVVPAAVSLSGDLVMHGAHGHPLLHLAPEGKSTAWMNGDFGFMRDNDNHAYTHVAEIGGGKRLSKYLQLNLSAGKIWGGQKTVFNGDYSQDMTYILPEVIANIPDTPLWATLSFQYAGGSLDSTRGYMNAGNQDFSYGSTHGDIYAGRARLDWKDAWDFEEITLTPYVDHQHTEIALSSYTENGGGFPAQWDGRHEQDDISRLGIDLVSPLTEDLKLLATAEQNYWWQGKGASSSGSVIGISSFNLPGLDYAKTWSHFALGLVKDIEDGQINATLNTSTSGQTPQFWLGVGYQYRF